MRKSAYIDAKCVGLILDAGRMNPISAAED
jgi:hypothetical protein